MAQPQVPAAQQMLSELYYSWNNMTSLSAAAAAAADANSGAEAAAAAQNGDWRAVVQAAAAAASQWEVQKLNAHGLQSRSNGKYLFLFPLNSLAALSCTTHDTDCGPFVLKASQTLWAVR